MKANSQAPPIQGYNFISLYKPTKALLAYPKTVSDKNLKNLIAYGHSLLRQTQIPVFFIIY